MLIYARLKSNVSVFALDLLNTALLCVLLWLVLIHLGISPNLPHPICAI